MARLGVQIALGGWTSANYAALACGTCHVHVRDDWAARLPPPAEDERVMLASLPDATPCSRLACQIRVTPQLAGLCLEIPH